MLAAIAAAAAPLEAWCQSQQSGQQLRSGNPVPAAPYDPRWSPLERSAWRQISAGHPVRLPGPCPEWRTTDQQRDVGPDLSASTLSAAFLAQLMTESPYREITVEHPITISGARIAGDLYVRGGRSAERVIIHCSVITGSVTFIDRRMEGGLDLSRVWVAGAVEFTNIRSGAAVSVARSDVGAVDVIGGRIDGSLGLRGTRVRSHTLIGSTHVEGGIRFGCPIRVDVARWQGCRAEYREANLSSVRVGHALETTRAVFGGALTLQAVELGGGFLGQMSEYRGGLEVWDGSIGGRVLLSDSVSTGPIRADGTRIRGPVDLARGTFDSVIVVGVAIGGSLDLTASTLRLLDLTDTKVGGDLRLGSDATAVDWGCPRTDAWFVARDAHVRSLQDSKASWQSCLKRELDGFEYENLRGHEADLEGSAYLRSAGWFKQWLAGDESYSPHPYRHLSVLLRERGQKRTADSILFEAKERERRSLPWADSGRWWLELLRYSVGYGLGLGPLRALGWMALLALFGWGFGLWATRGRGANRWIVMWTSMSYTVPGFTLVDEDRVVMPLCARSWFYVQRLLCFGLALLAGAAAVGMLEL